MEEKICIGDIRNTCEEYYNTYNQMLSFGKALKLTQEKERIPFEQEWSNGYMDFDEFFRFVDSIPLFDNLQKRRDTYQDMKKEILRLEEKFMFEELEDLKVIAHIPCVNNGQHVHDHFEIIYIYGGAATLVFNEERKVLEAGTLGILVPGHQHNVEVYPGTLVITIEARRSSLEMMFFPLLKQKGHLSRFLQHSIYENESPNYLLYQTDNSMEIQLYFQGIVRQAKQNDEHSSMVIASLSTLLFSHIMRQYEHSVVYYDFNDRLLGSYNFQVMLQYIRYHYRTVTLNELSQVFHYKETYLSKKISEETGSGFSQLLQNIRLENSKVLLRTTKYSLHKICDFIGYESTDHFARLFKKKFGVTPSQYRAEQNVISIE